MKKSYLVTGGSGFLGGALVHRLVHAGHRVRVLDNHSRGSRTRLAGVESEIEFVRGDIRDLETVQRATEGVDAVCHLAFVNGTEFFYTKPELVLEVGVKGMMNVVDACLKHGVGELILASSSEVYQDPPTVPTDEHVPLCIPDPWNPRYSYAGGKIVSELIALNYGRTRFERVIIFRPHNVYGPEMGWEHVIPQFAVRMKRLMESGPGPYRFPIQGTGEEKRSFIYIDDFTDGLMLVLEHGTHLNIYHIGTTEEICIRQLAQMVAACFGQQVEVVRGQILNGGPKRRCPDISRIMAMGFRPRYPLGEGLAITCRWYDENAHRAPKHLRAAEERNLLDCHVTQA